MLKVALPLLLLWVSGVGYSGIPEQSKPGDVRFLSLRGYKVEDTMISTEGGISKLYFLLSKPAKDLKKEAVALSKEIMGSKLFSRKNVEWVTGVAKGRRVSAIFGWGSKKPESASQMKAGSARTGYVKCLLSFGP